MKRSRLLLLALALTAAPTLGRAVETDPDLPQPFDPNTVAPLIKNSPFSRMVSVSDSLILTGIAYIDGKPVATIRNKDTKQSFVVSDIPNFQGWTLNEASATHDVTRSQAKVTIGGEVVSIRYDAAAMTNENLKGGKKAERAEGGERGDRLSRGNRGPSEEDRKRYETLSEGARDKFRNMMREKFSDEKFRNAPEEERRNMIRREFEKIEKDDKKGK